MGDLPVSIGQIGLICDICGATFLGLSFVQQRHIDLIRIANPTFDQPVDIESIVAPRNDARIGLPILVFGFLLQFLSPIVGKDIHPGWSWIILFFLIDAVLVYLSFRKYLIRNDAELIRNALGTGTNFGSEAEKIKSQAIVGAKIFS